MKTNIFLILSFVFLFSLSSGLYAERNLFEKHQTRQARTSTPDSSAAMRNRANSPSATINTNANDPYSSFHDPRYYYDTNTRAPVSR